MSLKLEANFNSSDDFSRRLWISSVSEPKPDAFVMDTSISPYEAMLTPRCGVPRKMMPYVEVLISPKC